MLKKPENFYLIVFCFFALISCGKDTEPVKVGPGIAQQQVVFSKTCPAGSFKVSKKTAAAAPGASPGTWNNFYGLNQGDSVDISGTFLANGLCGFAGSVSFSCSGSAAIDTNRSFVCQSGTISGSGIASPYTTAPVVSPTAPAPSPAALPGARSFLSGNFIVYDNGTKSSAFIQVSPSQFIPHAGPCRLGWDCRGP